MRTITRPRRLAGALLTTTLVAGAALAGAAPSTADGVDATGDRVPIFDFTDAYYTANGVKPGGLVFRPTGNDPISVVDEAPANHLRDVRVKLTLPAYDHSGDRLFFTVLGDLPPNGFTANAAGRRARQLAEASPVYVFPTRGSNPTSISNNRQADLIDMRHGYFSNNPLGIWVHVFVNWTPRAFNTAAGRRALNELAADNGRGLDGTPIITDLSELEDLTEAGLVTQVKRPQSEVGRYFICPVYKDPRDGAIADDAFLAMVRRPDGTPLPAEQAFLDDFVSLQTTGDYAD